MGRTAEGVPYSDQETSQAAAEAKSGSVQRERQRVLHAVYDQGQNGATCDEVEVLLGLSHQTASARLNDLERMNRVHRPGETRTTRRGRQAKVYIATTTDASGKVPHTVTTKVLSCAATDCYYNTGGYCANKTIRIKADRTCAAFMERL
jgi:predicted transcriptional regulator